MNKYVVISLAAILIGGGALGGVVYVKSKNEKLACPLDTMVCPDGTTIPRTGPNCEFGTCKIPASQPAPIVEAATSSPIATSSEISTSTSQKKENLSPSTTKAVEPKKEFSFSKVISGVVSGASSVVSSLFQSIPTPDSRANTQNIAAQNTQTNNQPLVSTTTFNEERLTVVDNKIVDQSGTTIATIPSSVSTETGTSSWETHTVNAIEVGSTTPVVDGVPVVGAAGKYYVSENSFGSPELCEFSNKIYILDVIEATKTLLYEENSSTLSRDDQRACNSEIFLLATEDEKLIMKYHTINTNMICESTWSEPDKTWYLDVTNLVASMRRYYISNERYSQAEQDEIECRATLNATN